jgi:hypothetical protein
MRYPRRILAMVAATVLLSGCVANRSYRRGDVNKNEFPPSVDPAPPSVKDCSQLPEYECVQMPEGKEPQHFYLAHIEFDDMGELWSIGDLRPEPTSKPSQLENALSVIQCGVISASYHNTRLSFTRIKIIATGFLPAPWR